MASRHAEQEQDSEARQPAPCGRRSLIPSAIANPVGIGIKEFGDGVEKIMTTKRLPVLVVWISSDQQRANPTGKPEDRRENQQARSSTDHCVSETEIPSASSVVSEDIEEQKQHRPQQQPTP